MLHNIYKMILFLPFLVIISMFPTSHAEVISFITDEDTYSLGSIISFSGTVNDSETVQVFLTINSTETELITKSMIAYNDGAFNFGPFNTYKIFSSPGTYTITSFTEHQDPKNGISTILENKDKQITVINFFDLKLESIGDKTIEKGKTISFTVEITDTSMVDEVYSLANNPPAGASINPATGLFTWTLSEVNKLDSYVFDIVVQKNDSVNKETITITIVNNTSNTADMKIIEETKENPTIKTTKQETEMSEGKLVPFIDSIQNPQEIIDRYNNEQNYKKWFDTNYPEYSSIYEAVGIIEPLKIPALFVDDSIDPQHYINRYNSEQNYKKMV